MKFLPFVQYFKNGYENGSYINWQLSINTLLFKIFFFGGMLYTELSHQVFEISAVSKLKTKGICKFVANGGIKNLIAAKH